MHFSNDNTALVWEIYSNLCSTSIYQRNYGTVQLLCLLYSYSESVHRKTPLYAWKLAQETCTNRPRFYKRKFLARSWKLWRRFPSQRFVQRSPIYHFHERLSWKSFSFMKVFHENVSLSWKSFIKVSESCSLSWKSFLFLQVSFSCTFMFQLPVWHRLNTVYGSLILYMEVRKSIFNIISRLCNL